MFIIVPITIYIPLNPYSPKIDSNKCLNPGGFKIQFVNGKTNKYFRLST